MVSMDTTKSNPVYGAKLSSVVPAKVTGEDEVHELTNMDLVMKLHYVRGVYIFREDAVRGLTIHDLKKPMFQWLELYYTGSGRIRRRSEGDGRPFVKCNDSGVRIVEAKCEKTVDEWLLEMEDKSELLVHDQVLGPDLGFSPLIFIQFTWFKCGGMSVGLSWAHVLGDVFSASSFINLWGHIMSGHMPMPSSTNSNSHLHPPQIHVQPSSHSHGTLASVKTVDPVGDHWLATNNRKMGSASFHISTERLERLRARSGLGQVHKISTFELISSVLWKSISKVREDQGPRTVVVCENNVARGGAIPMPINGMAFSRVEADFSVAGAEVMDIMRLFGRKTMENSAIDGLVDKDCGRGDYVAYGAELTFVDLEGLDLGGLEIKGIKPVFANYTIGGAGDEGVIMILPGVVEELKKEGNGMGGRRVTMVLPEILLEKLKDELTATWEQ